MNHRPNGRRACVYVQMMVQIRGQVTAVGSIGLNMKRTIFVVLLPFRAIATIFKDIYSHFSTKVWPFLLLLSERRSTIISAVQFLLVWQALTLWVPCTCHTRVCVCAANGADTGPFYNSGQGLTQYEANDHCSAFIISRPCQNNTSTRL